MGTVVRETLVQDVVIGLSMGGVTRGICMIDMNNQNSMRTRQGRNQFPNLAYRSCIESPEKTYTNDSQQVGFHDLRNLRTR